MIETIACPIFLHVQYIDLSIFIFSNHKRRSINKKKAIIILYNLYQTTVFALQFIILKQENMVITLHQCLLLHTYDCYISFSNRHVVDCYFYTCQSVVPVPTQNLNMLFSFLCSIICDERWLFVFFYVVGMLYHHWS